MSRDPGEFKAWSSLPFRDPAERMNKAGQGFSKMLSSMNAEQLSRIQNNATKDPISKLMGGPDEA